MISLDEDLIAVLDKWAQDNRRDRTNAVTVLLEDALHRHAEVKEPRDKVEGARGKRTPKKALEGTL